MNEQTKKTENLSWILHTEFEAIKKTNYDAIDEPIVDDESRNRLIDRERKHGAYLILKKIYERWDGIKQGNDKSYAEQLLCEFHSCKELSDQEGLTKQLELVEFMLKKFYYTIDKKIDEDTNTYQFPNRNAVENALLDVKKSFTNNDSNSAVDAQVSKNTEDAEAVVVRSCYNLIEQIERQLSEYRRLFRFNGWLIKHD